MTQKLTAIDLFCGAGGLSEGFRQAGYHILAGNDFDMASGLTFSATHPEAVFLPGPIENYKATDFLKAAKLKRGELNCLIGGPPCQGFSVNNHQRGMHDARSSLYQEYLRMVDGLWPEWVVLENVTGMLSVANGAAIREIMDGLAAMGYNVEYKILKAEEYGVPQMRRRIIFIGNRIDKPIVWPEITHGINKKPLVTVHDAISDLPSLANGEEVEIAKYATPAKTNYQKLMRQGSKIVLNHSAPKLGKLNVQRIAYIPQGGSWRDIPVKLLPEGMKRAKRTDHTKRYGRLEWSGLASTILTKCDLHWGAYIHPEQDRGITVREAARFQSFPDWFTFLGSRTEQYQQVGNAVPPILGKAIAENILRSIQSKSEIKLLAAAE